MPEIPPLKVAVNVTQEIPGVLDGPPGEVTIEMSQDEEIVVALIFPNTVDFVDREAIGSLFELASQSWPSILDQLEGRA